MELLFLALAGILRALIGFQIILLILSSVITHTLLAEKNRAVRLILIECDVWTAWARCLLPRSFRRYGSATDVPLLLTECALYVISAGM